MPSMIVKAVRKTLGLIDKQELLKLEAKLQWGIFRDSKRKDPNDPPNAMLLFWHEYGTRTEPARPSVGPAIATIRPEILRQIKVGMRKELRGKKGEVKKALHNCGRIGVEEIDTLIRSFIPPPITERTKRWRLEKKPAYQRASPKQQARMMKQWLQQDFIPLLDTEQMIKAITYRIKKD